MSDQQRVRVSVGGPELVDVEALAPVYAAAFVEPPYSEPDAADLRRRLPAHVGRKGFALATAIDDGRTVGFAYGFIGRFGQVWTDSVAHALGPARAAEVLDGHFELVELAVEPAARSRGIGAALLDAILHDRSEPRVLLQTHDGDTAAMRLYLRQGFTRLVGMPTGLVMMKELP